MTKGGKLMRDIFEGATINTVSMLCIEDAVDAMDWGVKIGGLKAMQARADANFKVLSDWVAKTDWVDFLAQKPETRSNTSVCLVISDPAITALDADKQAALAKAIVSRLDKAGVAYDIGGYRDAPTGLRIWAGSTVEASDLAALTPWLDYAFAVEKAALLAKPPPKALLRRAGRAALIPPFLKFEEGAMPKVLVSDKLSPTAVQIFKDNGVEVDYLPDLGKDKEKLLEVIGQYDGLAIRSATKVTEKILAAATNLKVIGRAGIGVDNVDIPAATTKGIIVMNTPFGNSITTAEHAIAMMMALARQLPEADASTRASKWEKNRFMGVEVTNKTLGLIGAGNIGSIVADRAQGLKMKVIAFDPFLTPERAQTLGVEKVELDDLLARADFITLHTPLIDATRNIISAEALAKTKKGVRIINCARGGLVDEAALYEALKSGQVAGAALDVFLEEPAENNPLFELPNVICTPASGRIDHRSAGECGAAGGRADFGLPDDRRDHQCAQLPVHLGRGSAAPDAVHQAGRSAGLVCRPADRNGDQGHQDRVRGRCRRHEHPSDGGRGAQWRAQADDGRGQHGLGPADRQGSRHQCRGGHPRAAGRL